MRDWKSLFSCVLFICAFLIAGCGSDEAVSATPADTDNGPDSGVAPDAGHQPAACVVGVQNPCACADGAAGFQTCAADGLSFSACTCTTPKADGGASVDSGADATVDVVVDAIVTNDANDAGQADALASCTPGAVNVLDNSSFEALAASPQGFLLMRWQDNKPLVRFWDRDGQPKTTEAIVGSIGDDIKLLLGSQDGFLVNVSSTNMGAPLPSLVRIDAEGKFVSSAQYWADFSRLGERIAATRMEGDLVVWLSDNFDQNGQSTGLSTIGFTHVSDKGVFGKSVAMEGTTTTKYISSPVAIDSTLAFLQTDPGDMNRPQVTTVSLFETMYLKDRQITVSKAFNPKVSYGPQFISLMSGGSDFLLYWNEYFIETAVEKRYLTHITVDGQIGLTYELPGGILKLMPDQGGYVAIATDPSFTQKLNMLWLDANGQVTSTVRITDDFNGITMDGEGFARAGTDRYAVAWTQMSSSGAAEKTNLVFVTCP